MPEQNPPSSEKPIFLAPRASAGDGHGYRNQPLRRDLPRGLHEFDLTDHAARVKEATRIEDEPEAIGAAILESYREAADFRHSQRHMADVLAMQHLRPLLRAEDRLKDAERRAKHAKRRDLKGEFVALRGMLARFQRGGEEPKPGSSVLTRLERVEAKLDGLDNLAA